MASKKKSGFMVFTMEWKAKHGQHMNIRNATAEAGKIWQEMTAQERGPYNQRAKGERFANTKAPRLACTGVPIAQIDKERQEAEQHERNMKRQIETTVRNTVKNCQLDSHSYYFIMVNYFTRILKGGVYVPAEISVAEYSLKDGVCRKYHTFINPGVNIYGHHYEAQHHSETTHKLPLPPNAKGERDLGMIYNDVLSFIRDKETGDYPPVYTHRDSVAIVESVLEFIKADMGANNVDLQIYSIQYLFYILKEATCEMGEVEKPSSHYITDAFFERDFFEYQIGIACTYHEEIDKSKYCTQSCVTRWGFMFSDYMCRDIAIHLIPGRHVPESTNINAIINAAPSSNTYDDAESHISVNSESTYATKPLSEHKIYYDDAKSNMTSRSVYAPSHDNDDFPSLGASTSRKKTTTNTHSYAAKTARRNVNYNQFVSESEDLTSFDLNPWSSRSRCLPREPDTSHFDIDYTRDDLLSNVSAVSYGRGRGARMNQSISSTATQNSGRGKLLNR